MFTIITIIVINTIISLLSSFIYHFVSLFCLLYFKLFIVTIFMLLLEYIRYASHVRARV